MQDFQTKIRPIDKLKPGIEGSFRRMKSTVTAENQAERTRVLATL